MNTVIRVLMIMITLLAATALSFAILNFNKRQVLLTKVSTFVEQVVSVAQTIEAQDPEPASLTKELDESPVTDRVEGLVNKRNVFETYAAQLEAQNLQKLNFKDKKDQLNTLYAFDLVDGKSIVRKDTMGMPVKEGPGTMQELLDQLLARAKAQNLTLDKTRQALTKTREMVEENVDAINKLKGEGRETKKELTERKEEIVGLKDDKAKLQSEVTKLTSDKRELEGDVADLKNEVEKLLESQAELNNKLAVKEQYITNLWIKLQKGIIEGGIPSTVALSAGDKGKIIESNDEYKFAIIEFSPAAMAEMLGKDREKNTLPILEMGVRRIGRESAGGDFVTKVKLRHSVKDKNLVIADILTDWQQSPVEKGDVVFF